MSEQQPQATDLSEEERVTVEEDLAQADQAARAAQFGQTGDRIDPGMGEMGGAGASGGIQPDIARQSQPAPGNSSDLPKP